MKCPLTLHASRFTFHEYMRIIGGHFKGRRIKAPETRLARPTKDRIREAVFNIIAARVARSSVLDLFAASGSYGLEALSRGAWKAVFVEKNAGCVKTLKENIELLGAEKSAEIIRFDAIGAVKKLGKKKVKFDIVFADPPYNMGLAKKALIVINRYDILNPSGLIIIEHSKKEVISGLSGDVSILKQKSYGDTCISIFCKR